MTLRTRFVVDKLQLARMVFIRHDVLGLIAPGRCETNIQILSKELEQRVNDPQLSGLVLGVMKLQNAISVSQL